MVEGYSTIADETIDRTAAGMCEKARRTNSTVVASFNGAELRADPQSTHADVLEQYDDHWKRIDREAPRRVEASTYKVALEDMLELFHSWERGIFASMGVDWSEYPPAVTQARRLLGRGGKHPELPSA